MVLAEKKNEKTTPREQNTSSGALPEKQYIYNMRFGFGVLNTLLQREIKEGMLKNQMGSRQLIMDDSKKMGIE